jgi:NAD(P)-dependent dehydrogenase (short-subunit alcohol dehydrogenase family)
MKDKIILITGATSGIGKQTAISLASMGATVVVTGRNQESGNQAIEEIKKRSENEEVYLLLADISTINGIYKLSSEFKNKFEKLDVLINNAGSAIDKFQKTIDGFEINFAVNVIAPYLLTKLLIEKLEKSRNPRVITLTGGDLPSKLYLGNLQSEKSFDGLSTYSQTKIAMMCLMLEFSKKLQEKNITCNICYPGQASTKMTQNVTAKMLPWFARPFFPIFKYLTRPDNGESAKKASRSSVYLASSNEMSTKTGIYIDKNVKKQAMPKVVTDESNKIFIMKYVEENLKNKVK